VRARRSFCDHFHQRRSPFSSNSKPIPPAREAPSGLMQKFEAKDKNLRMII
jgi:hypothetical protein